MVILTLYIIGLGIREETELTEKLISILRRCKYVYWENYTSPATYNLSDIIRILEREVRVLRREDLEERIEDIIVDAKKENVAILVCGDPLIATTHVNIILEAKRMGIEYRVFHASSILSAGIGESGLHLYKFGPSGTIVREEKVSNRRNIDILKFNLENGLHTLYFLEYDKDEEYIMPPSYAIKILSKYAGNILSNYNPYIIILCGIGTQNPYKRALKYNEVIKLLNKLPVDKPCIIIVSGQLHYMEKEYIEKILR